MALPQVISRNSSQGRPLIQAFGRLTSTATSWYICPAGKKALYDGTFSVDAFGAGTEVFLTVDGAQASRRISVVDIDIQVKGSLVAGDILTYGMDTGSNATVDGSFIVEETPE